MNLSRKLVFKLDSILNDRPERLCVSAPTPSPSAVTAPGSSCVDAAHRAFARRTYNARARRARRHPPTAQLTSTLNRKSTIIFRERARTCAVGRLARRGCTQSGLATTECGLRIALPSTVPPCLPHQTIHLLQGVPCVQNLIPRRVQVGRRWSLAALESRLCREIARTGARRRVRA